MINITLFGEFKIKFNDVDVTTQLSKKGIGILLYMATRPNKLFYREKLSGIFWANYRKDSALNNLRYTLWQIRKEAKAANIHNLLINSGKHAIKVNPKLVTCDFLNFTRFVEVGNFCDASILYNGEFLESFYLEDVPDFSDWVFNEREIAQRKFFDVQLKLAENFAANNNLKEATKSLDKLIEIDPLNEIVHHKLMYYHYLSGNKVTAINTYRNLKQNLRDELNISPSDEIQKLFNTIIEENSVTTEITSISVSNNIQSTDNAMNIFVAQHPEKLYAYANKLAEYKNSNTQIVLDICDSPGIRINYEGLFEILDDLTEYGDYSSNNFIEEFKDISSDIKNKAVKEDLFLFNQFETLIKNENSRVFVFRVWNFHFLDAKTIDFLSYLYRKKGDKKMLITGVFDDSWNNERLKDFLKAHDII